MSTNKPERPAIMRSVSHKPTARLRVAGVVGLAAAVAAMSLTSLAGCTSDKRLRDANNRLRENNLALEKEVATLRTEVARRSDQLEALDAAAGRPRAAGIETPQLAELTFGRFSAAIDTNGDDRDDTLRVYLRTLDQQGRFLVVAGEAVIRVVAASSTATELLAEQKYDAAAFSTAYRSGVTGVHYAIEAPLPADRITPAQPLTVTVGLVDAATGAQFEHTQVIKPIAVK